VIGLPPFEAGADQVRLTWALPAVAASPLGAPGTVAGVAEAVDDGLPGPTAFVATTLKEYNVPFVRPVTVQFVVPAVEQIAPPGLAVAV
jgi:hypothetical protein